MRWTSRMLLALPSPLARLAAQLRARLPNAYAVKSYSQEGEDLILQRIFGERATGFYVDVGAHHPQRFSNTHTFYRAGWRGINIEPNPQAHGLFASMRPRDINLQLGVAGQSGRLTYHEFDDGALNTFDATLAQWRVANTPYRLLRTIEIPVERLEQILARHLPAGQRIDFLSVDAEGFDLAVLQSNDWLQYRPEWVLVEALDTSLEQALHGDVHTFLSKQGYELLAKTFNTLMFRDRTAGRA
jgi:FkbM family methyltransferase